MNTNALYIALNASLCPKNKSNTPTSLLSVCANPPTRRTPKTNILILPTYKITPPFTPHPPPTH